MSRRATLPMLSGFAAMVVLAYTAWSGGGELDQARQPASAETAWHVAQGSASPRAHAFPWLASGAVEGDPSSAIHQSSSVDELLWTYQQGGPSPDSKRQIRNRLHLLKQDSTARNRMIECFVGRHGPSFAQAMYGLMRDADFKDAGLIEDLIQRLPADADSVAKQRLIDLIADEMSLDDGAYSPVIHGYLFQLTQSHDEALRQSATTQRIWYVAKRQPERLTTLVSVLRDSQPTIREEMYGLIESALETPRGAQVRQAFAPVLAEHLHATDVVMPELERNRVSDLLAALNRP